MKPKGPKRTFISILSVGQAYLCDFKWSMIPVHPENYMICKNGKIQTQIIGNDNMLQMDQNVCIIKLDITYYLLNIHILQIWARGQSGPEWLTWMRLYLGLIAPWWQFWLSDQIFCVQTCLAYGQNTCCSLGIKPATSISRPTLNYTGPQWFSVSIHSAGQRGYCSSRSVLMNEAGHFHTG